MPAQPCAPELEADRRQLLIAVERMVRDGSSTAEISAAMRSLTGTSHRRATTRPRLVRLLRPLRR